MRYHFLIICFLSTFLFFSQEEKRLALVIGNSNYDKGELKNPVEDAILIEQKLDSLNFDVILATDIEDQRSMINKIVEFGDRREDYDVGFVYYAGHGVQIAGENYLLPTKEVFEKEKDVVNWGVSVQKIIQYLTSNTNQVNILVLDACRNNPFESTWNSARSIKGDGLARMQVTGTLVAFSTDAGNIAADGNGTNSLYTLSLAKNMMLFDTSLDQVFRNVRREVLAVNPKQKPMEWSQLTGDEFFLRKSDLSVVLDEAELLYKNKDYNEALRTITQILEKDKKYIDALYLRSDIYEAKEEYASALNTLDDIIEINKNIAKAYYYKGLIYQNIEKNDLAVENFNKAIDIEPENDMCYSYRGNYYKSINEKNKAIEDYSYAIKLNNEQYGHYWDRGNVYVQLKKYSKGIDDLNKSIELHTFTGDNISKLLNSIGLAYEYQEIYDSALEYYNKSIESDSLFLAPYRNIADIYKAQSRYEESYEMFTKVIEISSKHRPEEESFYYGLRSRFHQDMEEYDMALADISEAISIYDTSSDLEDLRSHYFRRAYIYDVFDEDQYSKAIEDYIKSNEIRGHHIALMNIGVIYRDVVDNNKVALEYFNKSAEINDTYSLLYRNRANTYIIMEDFDKAEDDYNKAISVDPDDWLNYSSRADFYSDIDELDKAEIDYTTAIRIDSTAFGPYQDRAYFYDVFRKDWDKAILDYNSALKINPERDIYRNIAIEYAQNEKIKDPVIALEYINKAIELDSLYANGYLTKASIYAYNFNDSINKAIENYDKMVEIDPSLVSHRADFYKDYGDYTEETKYYEMAIDDFSKAIELDPSDSYSLFQRGWIYGFNLDKKDLALLDFNRSNDLAPDASNINNIGSMFREKGDYEISLEWYDKAITMDSSSYFPFRNKGRAYVGMSEYDKALENYNIALELDSTVALNYNWRGRSYFGTVNRLQYNYRSELTKDQSLSAENDFTKAIEFSDQVGVVQKSDFYDDRAFLYSYLERYDDAIEDYKRSNELSEYWSTLNNIGAQYYKKNEIDSALVYYDKAIIEYDNADSHVGKAKIYQNLNLYEDSLAEFYKVIEINPETNNYFYLINLYISNNKFDKAIEVSKKIIKLSPEDPDIYYKRSLIYERQEEYVKAIHDSNMSIARLGLGDYFIGAIDNSDIQLGMADLYKHRISLYRKKNMNDFVCEDLNALRELIIKEKINKSDMISKLIDLEKFAAMSVSDIENCRN